MSHYRTLVITAPILQHSGVDCCWAPAKSILFSIPPPSTPASLAVIPSGSHFMLEILIALPSPQSQGDSPLLSLEYCLSLLFSLNIYIYMKGKRGNVNGFFTFIVIN